MIDEKQVLELYASGLNAQGVGERLNLVPGKVLEILNKHEVKLHRRGPSPELLRSKELRNQRIVALHLLGLLPRQIAPQVDLTSSHVWNILRKRGLL